MVEGREDRRIKVREEDDGRRERWGEEWWKEKGMCIEVKERHERRHKVWLVMRKVVERN